MSEFSTKWETRFKVMWYSLFEGSKRMLSLHHIGKSDAKALDKVARKLNRQQITITKLEHEVARTALAERG